MSGTNINQNPLVYGCAGWWQRRNYVPVISRLIVICGVKLKRLIAESDKEREVMLKDLRLVEAALATDRTVISLDNKVRKCFAKVAVQVDGLKDIIWVNPAQMAEKPLDWLQNGAELEIERSLGFPKADN